MAGAALAAPASAFAKGGEVVFDRYPDVQKVGAPMRFTVLPRTVTRGRPLVAFRNVETGIVVRVRAARPDANGRARGVVLLPSTGPWETRVTVGGADLGPGDAPPFRVGVGLFQIDPPPVTPPIVRAIASILRLVGGLA